MKLSVWVRGLVMGRLVSEGRRRREHRRQARARQRRGEAPTAHYFHQVGDPYSHLAAQKLQALRERYAVELRMHLVSAPGGAYQGDEGRFRGWAVRDARAVAEFYGAELPTAVDAVDEGSALNAVAWLAGELRDPGFAGKAVALGQRLWRGEAVEPGPGDAAAALREGDEARDKLGHYLSATFYFEGEWYWGVDRLYHLERRLAQMGLSRLPEAPLCVPRPEAEPATGKGAGQVTLEYYPSLRSPYTAVSYARTFDLAARSGVTLELKPVMPMMMRGVPAPRRKQFYIMTDAKREAEAAGVPFGKIVDPFGEPVKRAFSLFPYMRSVGKAADYVASYLQAAWQEGLDITTDKGLRQVVERTGASWQEASKHLGGKACEALLEANVNDLLRAGLWGVPSFRVTGGNRAEAFQCWGQDRLWRVETEIARRAS